MHGFRACGPLVAGLVQLPEIAVILAPRVVELCLRRAARAAARLACLRPGIGLGLGLGFSLGFFGQQSLPVGNRDLVVVGMDFAEGEEAVAVAAIVDKRRLQGGLYARDLCQINVAAQKLAGGRFVVELLYPAVAEHHDPSFLGMRGVDEHLVVLVHLMGSLAPMRPAGRRPEAGPAWGMLLSVAPMLVVMKRPWRLGLRPNAEWRLAVDASTDARGRRSCGAVPRRSHLAMQTEAVAVMIHVMGGASEHRNARGSSSHARLRANLADLLAASAYRLKAGSSYRLQATACRVESYP